MGGQVLEVFIAPILVPASHPYPFVTLSQPLLRSRFHFEADFASGAARRFGAWGAGLYEGQGTCAGGWRGARAPKVALLARDQAGL